jgi:hypothetical protein
MWLNNELRMSQPHLRVVGRQPTGQPRTYRLEPVGPRQAAYRRLAVAILGLDVPTLARQLRANRPAARAA